MFVFTSCTNNYIPKARILASTLKSQHPDWTFCLLLGEAVPEGFDLAAEPFDRVVFFDELGIQNYLPWLFRHRVVEICTAAKGPALYHFLVEEGHDKVMYIDPDIMVFNSLAPLEQMLDEHDILLTPHQRTPQPTKKSVEDNELVALQFGVFNLGFVGVAHRGQGPEFSRWWCDRLLEYCYDDIPRGLFTDQRWCDLAPCFFSRLHVVRDPGYNAASWNLTDRTVTQAADGTFMANDVPLRFYHFTGYDSGAGEGMTAQYAARMPAVHRLWDIYKEKLHGFGHDTLRRCRWTYMTFDDGSPITDDMRLVYRQRPDLQRAFPDPFRTPGYKAWYMAGQVVAPVRRKPAFLSPRMHRAVLFVHDRLSSNGGWLVGPWRLARKALSTVRREGLRNTLRATRHKISGPPAPSERPEPQRPALEALLRSPDSMGLLGSMLRPEARPLLVVEHDWGGGAASYLEERVTRWLAQGRAVLRVRYRFDSLRPEMLGLYQGAQLRCWMEDLRVLAHPAFAVLEGVLVNEMASWYMNPKTTDLVEPQTVAQVKQSVGHLADAVRTHTLALEFPFHDFYALCPRCNLMRPDGTHCAEQGLDGSACAACLPGLESTAIVSWRAAWKGLLEQAREVVFFSENTRRLAQPVLHLRAEQVFLRPHSLPACFDQPVSLPQGGPLRVAVVGHLCQHKGADLVCDMARLLKKQQPEAEVLVFGDLLADKVPDNVRVLGPYVREDLPTLLEREKITVGAFTSVWPETFSFVVHELAGLGLPLACLPLGAQGDFVAGMGTTGRVAKAMSAEALLDALLELDAQRHARS